MSNDVINGTSSADSIDAGIGDDTIYAYGGNDTLIGGTGSDRIFADTGNDLIYSGDGSDHVYGGTGNDTIYGGSGDALYGNDNDDLIILNPTELDSAGQNTTGIVVYGDLGNDTLDLSQYSDFRNLSETVSNGSRTGSVEVQNSTGGWTTVTYHSIETLILPPSPDGIVDGTSGDDVMGVGYIDAQGDEIDGADGLNDTVYGYGGNDTINAGAGNDLVYGGQGNESINGGDGHDTLYGDEGHDLINGATGNDLIFGGDGSDTLIAGTGNDTLYGDAGNDVLNNTNGSGILYGGTGNDQFAVGLNGGVVNIEGGENAGDQDTLLLTGVSGGSGASVIFTGDEAGIYSFATGTGTGSFIEIERVLATSGSDTINASAATTNLELWGAAGNDSIVGGAGNDLIYGDNGEDFISSGAGNDTVYGGTENDTIFGGAGNDLLFGDAGSDTIYGGAGDTISGGADADTIIINESELDAAGLTTMGITVDGGNTGVDNDTLDLTSYAFYRNLTQTTDPDGNSTSGTVEVQDADGDWVLVTFAEIENLLLPAASLNYIVEGTAGDDLIDAGYTGDPEGDMVDAGDNAAGNDDDVSINSGDGNDTILGDDGNDTITAGAGDDVVFGGEGNDQIIGGTGNNTLYGDAGNDAINNTVGSGTIYGGDGTDQLIVGVNGGVVDVFGGESAGDLDNLILNYFGTGPGATVTFTGDEAGTYDFLAGPGTGSFAEIERVTATAGNDTVDASISTVNLQVSGGAGDDVVLMGSGNDRVFGDAGNDTIVGGLGADSLYGGADRDVVVLEDAFGNDSIFGGETGDDWDQIDASAVTQNTTLVFSADETGTISNGTHTAAFTEIEEIQLGSGNDTVNATGTTGGVTVDTGAGDDSILGGSGDDTLTAGTGADTVDGGAGDDLIELGTDGEADVIVFADGDGNDTLSGLDAPIDNGDGTFTGVDTLDVSGLTDTNGAPVNTNDVTVSDDGTGNAVLTFPNGETITLVGVDPATADNPAWLEVLGIPAPNYIVEGTAGDDLIEASYTGDPEGDMVDGNDAADGSNDDVIEAGAGNDTVLAGAGDDLVYGGEGNDSLFGGEGNDTLWGDEGDDRLDGGAGADTILGGGGGDTIEGGDGDDLIYGGYAPGMAGPGSDDTVIWLNSQTRGLFRLDDVNGEPVLTQVTADTGIRFGDIGFGPDGVLYGTRLSSNLAQQQLYSIDPDTGASTLVGAFPTQTNDLGQPLTWMGVLSFDSAGTGYTSYGFTSTGIPQSNLYRFDLDDLSTIEEWWVNPDGGRPGGDVVVLDSHAYTVWVNDSGINELIRLDLDGNGDVTGFEVIGTLPNDGNSLTADAYGNLYVSGLVEPGVWGLYRIDDSSTVVDGGAGALPITLIAGSESTQRFDGATSNAEALLSDGPDQADLINSGAGNDTVLAGLGDDLVYGGEGNDELFGGDGNDTLWGDEGDDTLTGDAGDDRLDGGIGDDVISGGADNDLLYGAAGNDTLNGDDGNDTIDGGDGNDVVDGGLGDDQIFGGLGDDLLSGGDGNDTITAAEGADTLYGGAGNDSLMGGDGNDLIEGDIGDDTVSGGLGDDTIFGGEGNDSIGADEGDDLVYGGAGNDTIFGFEGNDTVDGGDGDDYINTRTSIGTGVPDIGLVHPTNPALSYPSDPDPNNDRDSVIGGLGNDTILTGDDDDTIFGGAGNDLIDAGFDDDLVYGGADNDTIEGNEGSDTIYGDDGDDLIYGGLNPTNPDYALASQYDLTDDIDPQPFNNADSLVGGAGNDTIYGLDDADTLDGGDGNDLLDGGIDNDLILGGSGDDSIIGGHGDDMLFGETGNDTIDGGTGNDMVDGDEGDDSLSGGDGNDTLVGDEGDDTLDGGAGDDELYGGVGNDTLIIGDGADTAFGSDDRDTFVIEAGGGIGAVIFGGEGGDDFDTLDLRPWGKALTNIIYDAPGSESGTVEFLDGGGNVIGTMTFSEIENVIPCFTPGSLILTDRGEVAVEALSAGDRVLTRDNGYQVIRWVGRRNLGAAELALRPQFAPIRIAAGALGEGLPERDMLVSPQHRMLVTGPAAEMLFGEHEVLVAAKHLVGQPGITVDSGAEDVSYIHILFDQHEIVRADGAWSESFQPGDMTLAGMDEVQRAEVLALFPELANGGSGSYGTARLTLKPHEVRVLLSVA